MKTTVTAITSSPASRGERTSLFLFAGAHLLMLAAALWLSSAHAQTPPSATPANAAATTPTPATSLQVGDATRSLLEKQRTGTLASETPRPIAGEVAQRSYERYLRSFERPIPESFTTVATPAGKSNK